MATPTGIKVRFRVVFDLTSGASHRLDRCCKDYEEAVKYGSHAMVSPENFGLNRDQIEGFEVAKQYYR